MSQDVAVLHALALISSYLPTHNVPVPVYAIVRSDTLIPLTIPTSWGEFSMRYDSQLSDYPQERGAFQVYNKVVRPLEVEVIMIKTGGDLARFAWLNAIRQQEAENPIQLYTIISPQLIATDYALAGMSYETRQDRGSNILYLTLRFMQIPEVPLSAEGLNSAEAKSRPTAQLGALYNTARSLDPADLRRYFGM